jgi:hypothetical protein
MLEKSIEALWEREKAYEEALIDAAEKEYAYRMKYAAEFKLSQGSNADARKQDATIATGVELQLRLKADAIAAFTKEALLDARAALSARQSILSAKSKNEPYFAGAGS